MEFMLSRHGLDDAAENERWKPWNILGQGGYGRVGVWRKVDENGEVLDEVAIKEQNLHKHKHLNKADPLTGLHEEAIIHLALQQKERAGLGDATGGLFVGRDRHILHMRQYKIDKAGKCRMYLDYCPHGTIAALQKGYRIFSKRFPVAFLWHMFHSPALAINVMNGRCLSAAFLYKWRKYQDRAEWPDADHWTIHLDIKDTNIFLCEPDHDNHKASKHDPRMDWPSLKLADFGCAIYTSSADKTNPWVADNGGSGTWDTMPPEQRRWSNDFSDPPNWVGQRWTPTHMVWQVAKIVWDCTFHWPRPKMTNDVMEEVAADLEQYERNGRHWISPTDLDLAPDRNLADLLHRCLHPTALNRPSTDELVKATREGLKSSLKRGDETMLFFRGREIRDMAPGDESFAPITDDYIQVRYRNLKTSSTYPGRGGPACRKRKGKRWLITPMKPAVSALETASIAN
jgi:serine/threonine protein kinase